MAKIMNLMNMMAVIIIIFNNIKIFLSIEGSGMPQKRVEIPGNKEKLGLLKKVYLLTWYTCGMILVDPLGPR